jgi:DNA-binding NarL/FixJ family response regulator
VGNEHVQFASNGDDALKLPRAAGRATWLVNIKLPDGSGCELAAAIRARDPQSVVYLVSDAYDPAEEIEARQVRGTMYLCKLAGSDWLTIAGLHPQVNAAN